jgi:antitoxin (DNA-binding transcriptional repressor) of toxin-antitoxin stability system
MTTVTVEEAEKRFSHYLELAASGERFVLLKGNVPIAELVPAGCSIAKPVLGSGRGKVEILDDSPFYLDDFRDYMP